jgi:hypothetical protein
VHVHEILKFKVFLCPNLCKVIPIEGGIGPEAAGG